MDDLQQVSIQIEAAMVAIQPSSQAVAIVFFVLSSILLLLFSASLIKRFTDRVMRSKIQNEEETFFSYFPSEFNINAAKKIIADAGHYRPPWWYSSNLGTIIAFGKDFECTYDEEVVESADGCRFIVSWYPRRPYINSDLDNNAIDTAIEDDHSRKSIVLYVPGLGLHAESKVSKNYALRMAQIGYTVGIVGVRGERLPLTCHRHCAEPILRPWHPALIDDLLATILRVHRLLPADSHRDSLDLFLTGYSAGGNIVQKTLQAMHQQQIRRHHAHGSHIHNCFNNPQSYSKSDLTPDRQYNNQQTTDIHSEQQLIRGAFCLCVNFDYLPALRRLEQTSMGKIYSFFMRRVSTDILRKHRSELLQQQQHQGQGQDNKDLLALQALFPEDTASGTNLSVFQPQWLLGLNPSNNTSNISNNEGLLSQFDEQVWRLRGFKSYEEQFRAFSMFDVGDIQVPTLMLQPRDDPLHLGDALRNIDLDLLRRNSQLLFMSPRCGNHFGFYEGGLWQTLLGTNEHCYSYPAKVSASYFKTVLQQYQLTKSSSTSSTSAVKQLRALQMKEMRQHPVSVMSPVQSETQCHLHQSHQIQLTTTNHTTSITQIGRVAIVNTGRSHSRSRSGSRSRSRSRRATSNSSTNTTSTTSRLRNMVDILDNQPASIQNGNVREVSTGGRSKSRGRASGNNR